VNAEIESEKLTQQELASFFVLLVAAGNETTRTALAHGLNTLGEYPEQTGASRRGLRNSGQDRD
jgi:cytochrome P450